MPGPDEPGFDPWCLTDQRVAHVFRRDRKAVDALAGMWAFDPDPTRTLALRAEIDGALIRGDVAYGVGHWYACPWPPIYVTKRRVRLARAQLHPPEHFTYVLEFEGNPKRGRLRRRIVTGAFHPTRRVGYL